MPHHLGTDWRETKKNYLFMNIFKVLKNFYGFPWQLRTLVCSRVEGAHTSHWRNVNNGMRERQNGDTSPDHLTRALCLNTALLHATTPSLLHPLNYRLTWTSWAMRLIIKWTWPRHRANNISVWRIHNNNKLQPAGSTLTPLTLESYFRGWG